MKRIDLLGAPGVGKSTLYESLRRHKKMTGWMAAGDVMILAAQRYLGEQGASAGSILARFILMAGSPRVLVPSVANKYVQRVKKMLLRDTSDQYAEWLNLVVKSVCASNATNKSPLLVFHRCGLMLDAFAETLIVNSMEGDEYVLIDESLTNKSHSVITDADDLEVLEAYVNLMPKPDAVIYLEGDLREVLRRLESRTRTTVAHHNMTETEISNSTRAALEISRKCADLLEKTVPVCRLDALKPIDHQTAAAVRFISTLAA